MPSANKLDELAVREAGHVVVGYSVGLRLQFVSLGWFGDHWQGGAKFDESYNPPGSMRLEVRERTWQRASPARSLAR